MEENEIELKAHRLERLIEEGKQILEQVLSEVRRRNEIDIGILNMYERLLEIHTVLKEELNPILKRVFDNAINTTL